MFPHLNLKLPAKVGWKISQDQLGRYLALVGSLVPEPFGSSHSNPRKFPLRGTATPRQVWHIPSLRKQLQGLRWGGVTPASLRGFLDLGRGGDPSGLAIAWLWGTGGGSNGMGCVVQRPLCRWSLGIWAAHPHPLLGLWSLGIVGMDLQHPSPPRSEAEQMLPALSPWISLPPPGYLSLLTTRPQGRAICVYLGLGAQELAELAQAGALNPPRLPPTVALLIVYIRVC